MDFGNLLSRAWNIVWKNKFMLVLGFLAALGGGSGSASGNAQYSFGGREISPRTLDDVVRFLARYGTVLSGLICAGVFILIILWLIRLTAQASLIGAAARIDAGETLSFGEALSGGTSKLGRMIGVNLILYGPFTLIGLIAAAFALITAGSAIASLIAGRNADELEVILPGLSVLAVCFACLACLLVPVFIIVTAIYPFAQRGAVLQDLGVIDSIRHGWNIIKENLGDVVLLIILFMVITVVFTFALGIVLIPIGLLFFAPAVLNIVARQTFRAVDGIRIAGSAVCTGLFAAAISSILTAFRSTAVTLAYQEFANRAEEPG